MTLEKHVQADLDLAKQRLSEKSLSLVITKKGEVLFETEAHGIIGLLDAVNKLGNAMKGSSVADRIVGRAAALLFVYSGVKAVFAATASHGGVQVLKECNIFHEVARQVPRILNSKKVDICPFEKLVLEVSDPEKAYEALKARCSLKQGL